MSEPTHSLIALQRRVIERLQKAGFIALAETANFEWSRGKQIHVADSMAVGEPHGELRGEFAQANKQAGRTAERRLDDLRQG